jgi:hypothetical protein
VAFGPVGRSTTTDLTNQYRAAELYLDRLCDKPDEFKNFGRSGVSQ